MTPVSEWPNLFICDISFCQNDQLFYLCPSAIQSTIGTGWGDRRCNGPEAWGWKKRVHRPPAEENPSKHFLGGFISMKFNWASHNIQIVYLHERHITSRQTTLLAMNKKWWVSPLSPLTHWPFMRRRCTWPGALVSTGSLQLMTWPCTTFLECMESKDKG